jgi:hypothetical protein
VQEEETRDGGMKMIQPFLHFLHERYHSICDSLLGLCISTLIDAAPIPIMLPLAEGIYYGDITHFTHMMKRPHSPLATVRAGSIVTLCGGIPLGNEHGTLVSISSRETNVQAALCDVLRCIDAERAGWFPKEVQHE